MWKIELDKVGNLSNLFLTLEIENQSDKEFWFICNDKIAK